MGLIVAEDGSFKGWLAAFLCCCAAVNEDESPAGKEKARARARVCAEQPQSLTPLSADPDVLTLNAFKGDEPIVDGTRQKLRKREQPSSPKPPNLGEKRPLGWWFGSPKSHPVQNQRPTISAPYSFRRLDHSEPQKQGLVPLRLGPVVLRDSPGTMDQSPLPANASLQLVHDRSNSKQDLFDENARPLSYRTNRDSPFERCQQRSSVLLQQRSPVETQTTFATVEQPAPAKLAASSTPRSQEIETNSSPIKSRSSSEGLRPRRKRSLPFVRRPSGDDGERLEQEILELNTIVEERKAEAARGNSPDQHVPAVAPGMPVHARSETLDSIGSALSRPLTNPTTPERRRMKRSSSVASWSSSRFSGWLSGVLPSSSPADYSNDQQQFKSQPHHRHLHSTHSQASTYTSGPELESPALTADSSSPSKGHSRSYTDESRMMTPLSYSSIHSSQRSRGLSKTEREEQWPIIATPSAEVGIAF